MTDLERDGFARFDWDRLGLPKHHRENLPAGVDQRDLDRMLELPLAERMKWHFIYELRAVVTPEEADEMLIDERWWPWLAAVPEAVHGRIHEAARTRLAAWLIPTEPLP